MTHAALPSAFRVRSFVRRGRQTAAQQAAYSAIWSQVGLLIEQGLLANDHFGRSAPRLFEIGFGSGQSLLALAQAYPQWDFIGVETHRPGIGAVCLGIQTHALTNLHLYEADAIDVLQTCIPDEYLTSIQLFFPDPWPKRRHHVRRLIQSDFVQLVVAKLIMHGTLHLATDWEDYAYQMMRVLSAIPALENRAQHGQFAERSLYRPTLTKFEQRAKREGRQIWELQFRKINI